MKTVAITYQVNPEAFLALVQKEKHPTDMCRLRRSLNITLEELAQVVGVSITHVQRTEKKSSSSPPYQAMIAVLQEIERLRGIK